MNELMIIKENATVVVADPFTPELHHEDPQAVIDSIGRHVRQFREEFNGLVEVGGLGNIPDYRLKELKKAAEADSKTLMDWAKDAKEAAVKAVNLDAVLTQISGAGFRIDPLSFRGLLTDCVKQIDAELAKREPPEETNRYVIGFQATPPVKAKIIKAVEKLAEVEYCEKQKEEGVK